MGEAKRRKAAGHGPRLVNLQAGTTLRPGVNVDEAIAHVEQLVESGKVEGFVQLALVATPTPGVFKLELIPMGLEPQRIWDMLTMARNAMADAMGFGRDQAKPAEGPSLTPFEDAARALMAQLREQLPPDHFAHLSFAIEEGAHLAIARAMDAQQSDHEILAGIANGFGNILASAAKTVAFARKKAGARVPDEQAAVADLIDRVAQLAATHAKHQARPDAENTTAVDVDVPESGRA